MPFSILFVAAAGIEILAIIGIMTFVTWQVLIVAILAMVAVKYVQVAKSSFNYFLISSVTLHINDQNK